MIDENHRLGRLARHGLAGGLGLGLFCGVVASGPYFRIWPASVTLLAIVCSSIAGAFIGYLAVALIVGALSRGPASTVCDASTSGVPDHSIDGIDPDDGGWHIGHGDHGDHPGADHGGGDGH
jgi:hypothetical protein